MTDKGNPRPAAAGDGGKRTARDGVLTVDSTTCANSRCRAPLPVDHVTLVTTRHVRRFCTVECIAEGQRANYDAIAASVGLRTRDGAR